MNDADSILRAGTLYEFEQWRNGKLIDTWACHNIIPTQGLDHILAVVCNAGSQVTAWFVGIFEANYTPIAGDTAASFVASSTESTAYAEAARPAWTESTPSGGSTTNSASKAEFTMNATKTIYGAFLTSVSTKSATTGTLLSASKFGTAKIVDSGDILRVTASLTITSS